jgi:hypothetical protein
MIDMGFNAWRAAGDMREWALDQCSAVEAELDSGDLGDATLAWMMGAAQADPFAMMWRRRSQHVGELSVHVVEGEVQVVRGHDHRCLGGGDASRACAPPCRAGGREHRGPDDEDSGHDRRPPQPDRSRTVAEGLMPPPHREPRNALLSPVLDGGVPVVHRLTLRPIPVNASGVDGLSTQIPRMFTTC